MPQCPTIAKHRFSMDSQLEEALDKAEEHVKKTLKAAEKNFFFLKAHKDILYSRLLLGMKEGTLAVKEAQVYTSKEWIDFSEGLAGAEVEYLELRRLYELLLKRFDASYLSLKLESPLIKRQL